MALLASVRNMLGRQQITALTRTKLITKTPLASVTTNRLSLEEQKEFWEKNEARLKRPLSPHLGIYKPEATSMLSLIHRASGLVMALGVYGISYALVVAPYDFAAVVDMIRDLHIPGPVIYSTKTMLSFLLVYHYINGMRHMAWDATYGFGLKELYRSGFTVLGVSMIISATIAAL